ncbi:MAG: NAD-dependent epimerase/dehydratase family protein [Polyangiaceae bacterium]
MSQARIALVTGASGHIGGWVARTLLDNGFRVRGVDVAEPPRGFFPYTERYEFLRGDVCDREAMRAAAKNVDAIFHLAMKHVQHVSGADAERELSQVAVGGLQSVLDAMRASPKRIRLVYTGTAGAVGETLDPARPRTETDWNEDPITPYAKAKIAAERELWTQSDVDAVALLPGMTVGPEDPGQSASNGRIEQLYRRASVPVWFTGGLNVLDVRDLARAQLNAFERGRSGQRYVIGGDNLTFRELSTTLRRLRGLRGRPWLRVPDRSLIAAVRTYEAVALRTGQKPFVTARQLENRLHSFAYLDSSLAVRELGFSPRTLDQTLRDLLKWSTEVGHIPKSMAP